MQRLQINDHLNRRHCIRSKYTQWECVVGSINDHVLGVECQLRGFNIGRLLAKKNDHVNVTNRVFDDQDEVKHREGLGVVARLPHDAGPIPNGQGDVREAFFRDPSVELIGG